MLWSDKSGPDPVTGDDSDAGGASAGGAAAGEAAEVGAGFGETGAVTWIGAASGVEAGTTC